MCVDHQWYLRTVTESLRAVSVTLHIACCLNVFQTNPELLFVPENNVYIVLLIDSVIYIFYCISLLWCWVNIKWFFSKEGKEYLPSHKESMQVSPEIYILEFNLCKSLVFLNEWAGGIYKIIQDVEIAIQVSLNTSMDSVI